MSEKVLSAFNDFVSNDSGLLKYFFVTVLFTMKKIQKF